MEMLKTALRCELQTSQSVVSHIVDTVFHTQSERRGAGESANFEAAPFAQRGRAQTTRDDQREDPGAGDVAATECRCGCDRGAGSRIDQGGRRRRSRCQADREREQQGQEDETEEPQGDQEGTGAGQAMQRNRAVSNCGPGQVSCDVFPGMNTGLRTDAPIW